jgi:hypothetical protein
MKADGWLMYFIFGTGPCNRLGFRSFSDRALFAL